MLTKEGMVPAAQTAAAAAARAVKMTMTSARELLVLLSMEVADGTARCMFEQPKSWTGSNIACVVTVQIDKKTCRANALLTKNSCLIKIIRSLNADARHPL